MYIFIIAINLIAILKLNNIQQNITALYCKDTFLFYLIYCMFIGVFFIKKCLNCIHKCCFQAHPKKVITIASIFYIVGCIAPYNISRYPVLSSLHIAFIGMAIFLYSYVLLRICFDPYFIKHALYEIFYQILILIIAIMIMYGTINIIIEFIILCSVGYLLYKLESL